MVYSSVDADRNPVDNGYQHEIMMREASKESMESHVFETDNLCVNARFVGIEDEEQSLEIVMKAKEN